MQNSRVGYSCVQAANAKAGRPSYFCSLIFHPYEPSRRAMIKEGWVSIAKLVFAALTLDLIYQFIAQPSICLRHAVIIAFLLMLVPCLILCGTITRLASRPMTRPTT
jgi:hypothetical protein